MTLNRRTTPFAVVAAAMAILAAALLAGVMQMARLADDGQRRTEEAIVGAALKNSRERLSVTLAQNAFWDEAYDRIGEPLDRSWTDHYLGAYAAQTAAIPVTAIFNVRGQVAYLYSTAPLASAVSRMGSVGSVRSLVDAAQRAAGMPPVPSTGFVKIGERLFIGAAQRIVPNDARIRTTLSRRFVLLYLIPLGAPELRRLQSDYRIGNLSWSATLPSRGASVSAPDARGHALAWLSWNAATPGAALALQAAPYALICFALIGVLQLILLRSWFQAAQKLRDESVARTMFLANASHELRTPLNAIIGFSECLSGEIFGPLSSRYRSYAQDIHASGKLLLGIVNEVLDLTRINSGDVATGALKLSAALEQPLRMLREYAKPESIEIRVSDESEGAYVRANEKALSQILLNLGSNAVKFSAKGSVVDIGLSRVPRGDHVELTVRDKGIGIPAEKLQQIGQPFFRAHNEDDGKPGSGLGLAIVKSLTDKLGGEFKLQSGTGLGTTVTVKLPVVSEFDKAA